MIDALRAFLHRRSDALASLATWTVLQANGNFF